MKRYVKTFFVWGALIATFYHFVTRQPMSWWPDTAIIGIFFGALAVIVAARRQIDRENNRRMWAALKALAQRVRSR